MDEIGGYLEFGGFKNNTYHNNAIALNTATNAVIYLIKAKNIKKIYLPYYLCDFLDKIKKYCDIEYYKINKDFTPDFNIKLNNGEYLYIVNYFGIFDNFIIKKYKNKFKNIIVDNVQAFFQMPVKGVNTIYSCRKFFGVPDGAYLYIDKKIKADILQDSSINRMNYLFGRLEEDANSYFNNFKNNEEVLLKLELNYMSKTTEVIMGALEYDIIRKKRTQNFKYLNKKLKKNNKIKLKDIDGAYMYPYYTDSSDKIRNKLLENKIYIPILWPNVLKQKNDKLAYDYALNILPLPCDQRYGKNEMKKIIKVIMEEN